MLKALVREEPYPGIWRVTDRLQGELPTSMVSPSDVPILMANSGAESPDLIRGVWWACLERGHTGVTLKQTEIKVLPAHL